MGSFQGGTPHRPEAAGAGATRSRKTEEQENNEQQRAIIAQARGKNGAERSRPVERRRETGTRSGLKGSPRRGAPGRKARASSGSRRLSSQPCVAIDGSCLTSRALAI